VKNESQSKTNGWLFGGQKTCTKLAEGEKEGDSFYRGHYAEDERLR